MDDGQQYVGMGRAVLDGLDGLDVLPDVLPDEAPERSPGWPPDSLPVVLWPVDLLRRALVERPGAQLARVVAEITDRDADALTELSDDALGDLVTACGRLQSWAAGLQAHAVSERAGRETNPLATTSLIGQVTSELKVTGSEATEVVVRAECGAVHPTVIRDLTAGQIDLRKANTLLRSAAQLTEDERAEAIRRYLPHAPRRTWRWLRTKMLAFAKTLHGSAKAARAEAERRSVGLDRAENDMGWLSAYLPATDAAAVWGVVDDLAHQLQRTAGEERNLGQLRADSLTGIVTGRLLPADRFAESATVSDELGSDAGESGGMDAPVCTCGGRAPVVHEVGRPVRVTPTRPVVRVTVPASVLLGLDDAPGDLAGFGPVPAETARQIAQDATWQRLVTDPATGVLVDYSTTAYQPGRVLRGAVEARDGTCTFPGCDRTAAWCDLDHIVPFDHDAGRQGAGRQGAERQGAESPGQTSAHNLHALCRRHHLLKTHAGWGVVRDPATGVTTWTTPTGRTSLRPPTVLDTHVDIEEVDPDTSYDLTLRAVTGRRLPRSYAVGEPSAVPVCASSTEILSNPDRPPF